MLKKLTIPAILLFLMVGLSHSYPTRTETSGCTGGCSYPHRRSFGTVTERTYGPTSSLPSHGHIINGIVSWTVYGSCGSCSPTSMSLQSCIEDMELEASL